MLSLYSWNGKKLRELQGMAAKKQTLFYDQAYSQPCYWAT